MVFESLSQLATGFEGCEKKLKLDFTRSTPSGEGSLRAIPREQIDHFLLVAQCEVISHISNDHFDAYVLSESSLFVYDTKMIIKTCGTTTLLQCLPTLLPYTNTQGFADPPVLQFSRTNFMFPKKQPFPHRSFQMEASFLESLYPEGCAHVLGPMNGPRWHLYTAGTNRESSDCTLEIVMFKLDRSAMGHFYKKTDEKEYTKEDATRCSGIDSIIPGATIDSHLFEPCGYSCNGMKDETYFTIHVTPEPECSFVSFETNLVLDNYDALVQNVLGIFKPGAFLISVLADSQGFKDAKAHHSWDGAELYTNNGTTSHSFPFGGNVAVGQFVQKITGKGKKKMDPATATATAAKFTSQDEEDSESSSSGVTSPRNYWNSNLSCSSEIDTLSPLSGFSAGVSSSDGEVSPSSQSSDDGSDSAYSTRRVVLLSGESDTSMSSSKDGSMQITLTIS